MTHRTLSTVLIAPVAVLSLVATGCLAETSSESVGTASSEIVEIGEGNELCKDLIAGQSIDAGDVCLSVQGNVIEVTLTTTDGWELNEAHLWTGTSISDMPQTRKGSPKIGNFPYNSGSITGSTSYSFSVPLSDFGLTGAEENCDPVTMFVAAHAAVQKDNGDGTYQTETGWGLGERFLERGSWATYFTGTLSCSGDDGGPVEKNCETAFAYTSDDLSFCNNDIDGDGRNETRWGWFGIVGPGSYSFPVYAGAAQCNLSKGTFVGTLDVEYDGGSADVAFTTNSPYKMDATHVYLDSVQQDTIAPGQFTSVQEGSNLTSALHQFSGLAGGQIYFSAHAEVCGF